MFKISACTEAAALGEVCTTPDVSIQDAGALWLSPEYIVHQPNHCILAAWKHANTITNTNAFAMSLLQGNLSGAWKASLLIVHCVMATCCLVQELLWWLSCAYGHTPS